MRVLLVSNGHGEDVIAAAVGRALRRDGAQVVAVPLVGAGRAFDDEGIPARGPRQVLPSGGYALRGPRRFFDDVRAGLIGATFRAWGAVGREAGRADALLVVGDRYALSVASVAATLRNSVKNSMKNSVAASRHRYYVPSAVSVLAWPPAAGPFGAPYGPLERSLMRRCRAVFPRDGASARWLREHGVSNVHDLGNPMLDACRGDAPLRPASPYLMLLPGTREDRWFSLPLMVEACRWLRDLELTPMVAWGAGEEPPQLPGWERVTTGSRRGVVARYRHPDSTVVSVAVDAFATILRRAGAVISTSGTAAEQSAGYGLPVVGFPTAGPQYTAAFAAGQKRALGEALELVRPNPEAIAQGVRDMVSDPERMARVERDGTAAMGVPGAAERIATHVWRDAVGSRPSTLEES